MKINKKLEIKREKFNWIRKKIKEAEDEIEKNKITLATADSYLRLIDIHKSLWEILYFKLNQEESYLLK